VHEVLVGDDPDSCGVEVELEDLDRSSQSREGPAQGVGELAKGDPPEDVMTNDRVLRLPTGEMIRIARTGDDSGGAVFEFEAVLPPRLTGPPAHKHRTETETFEVVEGTLRVRVGQDSRELGPGESVTVPPGTVHAFSNPADTPVRLITRETPAGQLEPQVSCPCLGWPPPATAEHGADQRRSRPVLRPARRTQGPATAAVAGARSTQPLPEQILVKANDELIRRTRSPSAGVADRSVPCAPVPGAVDDDAGQPRRGGDERGHHEHHDQAEDQPKGCLGVVADEGAHDDEHH